MMATRNARRDRRRRPRRLLLAALTASVLAFGLGGCVIIRTNSSTQLEVIGKVQITTTFCASDGGSDTTGYNPADPSCQGTSHKGNSNQDAVNNWNIQRKIAYRIPNNVTAPTSFTSTST